MKKNREIVLESRNKALINIGYNINKMEFLPKLEDEFEYKTDNKIRAISHILSGNFKTGRYVTSKFIEDNKLTIKENTFPLIIEYLTEKDKELGTKEYKWFKKYNIEQIVEQDKLEELLKPIEISGTKYNLRKENINRFFETKNYEIYQKILFIGFIRLTTGKDLQLRLRYEKEDKMALIDLIKENPNEFRKIILNVSNDVNHYLKENIIEN